MSGTSLDGADYALCSISDSEMRLRQHWHVDFPNALRSQLDHAARGKCSSHQTAQLHHDLGRFYAQKIACSPAPASFDLIGLHGQTVFHHPTHPPATLQIGEPAYLAEAARVPVVSNFRAADLAAGGEGAPLATLFHRFAFGQRGLHVCIQNLGGIGNVTSIDWTTSRRQPRIVAFDTGPANMLMDLAIRKMSTGKQIYDRDGERARRGNPCLSLVNSWLKHPFLKRKPPKSTGRELFGELFLSRALAQFSERNLTPEDQLASLTEFSASSIALNYQWHLEKPHSVILAGGGALNSYFVERIRQRLRAWDPAIELATTSALGWHPQSIEPAAFAFLAYRRLVNKPGNVPETTGARRAVVLGQMT